MASVGPAPLTADSASSRIDETLRSGIVSRQMPVVVAMAASERKILYAGAFGKRDNSGIPAALDSIFSIASMVKAITTVAALQLVEQGKVSLDEPTSKHLPQLANLNVLEGFDAAGKPSFRPAKTPVTLRHLLTHISGFCYDSWHKEMFRYQAQQGAPDPNKPNPLMFEPGTRWQYGQSVDWAGRMVEAVSGVTLENYFQERILRPLEMVDTSFNLPPSKFERMVSRHHRENGGPIQQFPRKDPPPTKVFNGGAGIYSTSGDFVRFMQMILNRGAGPKNARILQPKTVSSMMTNQIGELTAGKMKSFNPDRSADVDMHPGHTEKWGFGFLINLSPYAGGRSAGSLAWAGLYNTFYWIDPKRQRCAVIMMHFLPFVDKEAMGLLGDFERDVYRYL